MNLSLYKIFFFLLVTLSLASAQHTRLAVCILGDDTPGNFMGGSSLGSGLWVSDDTGKIFRQLGWKHGKTYSVDILGNDIYIARGDGLLASFDNGSSWQVLTNWRQTEVMDVHIDRTNTSHLTISTAWGNWESRDKGATWKRTSEIWIRDTSAALFSIEGVTEKKQAIATVRNCRTKCHIGVQEFVGSLDGGLWAKDGERLRYKCIAFQNAQIWSLQTFAIDE